MIVVDSSALIEIAIDAQRADACIAALQDADEVLISAATLTECRIVALGRDAEGPLTNVLEQFGLTVAPLTHARAEAAADAYRRFGKRRHRAGLNYGDTFAYALAHELGCPLLFVGEDFARTDIAAAIA